MCEFAYYKRYPRDIYADTRFLSRADRGSYNDLLDIMWLQGGRLRFDHGELARIAGVGKRLWLKVWDKLQRLFSLSEDGLWVTQKRMTAEIESARKVSETCVERGRKGGEQSALNRAKKRWTPHAKSLKNNDAVQAVATITTTVELDKDSPTGNPASSSACECTREATASLGATPRSRSPQRQPIAEPDPEIARVRKQMALYWAQRGMEAPPWRMQDDH